MAINREKARAAGYSDQEIDEFEAQEAAKKPPARIATAEVDAMEPPPPSTTIPEVSNTKSMAGTAGLAGSEMVKSLGVPALEIAGGAYGLKKFAVDPITRAINQMNPNATQVQSGQAFRGGQPGANVPARPVAPPAQGFTAGANPAWDAALSKPYQPPQPPTAQNFIQRMAGLAKQYSSVAGEGAGLVGRSAVAAAPMGAVVAAPGAAMMYGAYKNFQQQTPEQQAESAQSALAGQAPGQAW